MAGDVLEDAHFRVDLAVLHAAGEEVRLPDEVRHKGGGRCVVDGLRVVDLFEPAAVQDGDPVGHRERLVVVVRDQHGRDPGSLENLLHLFAHLPPHVRVQIAEGLVQQEHDRLGRERAGDRDALLLAAGEFVGVPVLQVCQTDEVQRRRDHARGRLWFQALQPERDVLGHGEVGEQRVVLKDHPDAALFRRNALLSVAHHASGDPDLSRVGMLEAGDGPEHRGLAAPAGAQDGQGRALGDVEGEIVERRLNGVGISDRHAGELDQPHTSFFSRRRVTTSQGSAVNAIRIRASAPALAYSASTVWM